MWIKPGTAGREAQTLPLCNAVPQFVSVASNSIFSNCPKFVRDRDQVIEKLFKNRPKFQISWKMAKYGFRWKLLRQVFVKGIFHFEVFIKKRGESYFEQKLYF